MGTEYILTDDDKPSDSTMAEDILELRLPTVGDHTGPVDYVHGTPPEEI